MAVKTEAPQDTYRTFFNERKGTLERIPKGISPGFNCNQGNAGRSTAGLEHLVQKTQEKAPEQLDSIINSILKSQVNKNDFYGFIEHALGKNQNRQHTAAVGLLDSKIIKFLMGKRTDISKNSIIMLESKLVNGKKYTSKHTRMGNAPSKNDWYNLIDWLMDASIFWDGTGLIYLAKISESQYMKIAVDISLKTKALQGTKLALPKVDTMYLLDLTTEHARGKTEFDRIMRMEIIR